MSAFLTSLLFAAGFATWIWTKVGRRTGSADPKSVAITAAAAGVGAFVVFFTFMKFVLGVN
ncbi:hypothetical protein BH09PAT4_BH09PAT4_08730 [soil metagenome]